MSHSFKGGSPFGPASLAGGKGKGGSGGMGSGKVGRRKGNPIDRATGHPMECLRCGSDQHLIAACPKGKGRPKGKGGGAYARNVSLTVSQLGAGQACRTYRTLPSVHDY